MTSGQRYPRTCCGFSLAQTGSTLRGRGVSRAADKCQWNVPAIAEISLTCITPIGFFWHFLLFKMISRYKTCIINADIMSQTLMRYVIKLYLDISHTDFQLIQSYWLWPVSIKCLRHCWDIFDIFQSHQMVLWHLSHSSRDVSRKPLDCSQNKWVRCFQAGFLRSTMQRRIPTNSWPKPQQLI